MTGTVPRSGFQGYYQNPKAFFLYNKCKRQCRQLTFFPFDFSYAFAKFICKNGFFCFKWFLCHIADLMGAFNGIWKYKNTSICHFQAIKCLWHTVHNVQFANSQEKPHKKAQKGSTSCTVPVRITFENKPSIHPIIKPNSFSYDFANKFL